MKKLIVDEPEIKVNVVIDVGSSRSVELWNWLIESAKTDPKSKILLGKLLELYKQLNTSK